jgi:hypothetical protein
MARLDSGASMAHLSRMLLGPAYLRKKLARPLPIKDATRLRTLADAVAYMAALPRHRECRQYWERACELILAQADIMEVSRQLELAVFPDATLDLVALYADA